METQTIAQQIVSSIKPRIIEQGSIFDLDKPPVNDFGRKDRLEKEFQELFEQWNREKFDNKLPKYRIQIGGLKNYFGRCIYNKKLIKIRDINDEEHMKNTLLHEIIHAELKRRGFRNTSHSVKFWRMFKEKGGIITSTNRRLYSKADRIFKEEEK